MKLSHPAGSVKVSGHGRTQLKQLIASLCQYLVFSWEVYLNVIHSKRLKSLTHTLLLLEACHYSTFNLVYVSTVANVLRGGKGHILGNNPTVQ